MKTVAVLNVIITINEQHTYVFPTLTSAMDKLETIKTLHPSAHAITAQLLEVEE